MLMSIAKAISCIHPLEEWPLCSVAVRNRNLSDWNRKRLKRSSLAVILTKIGKRWLTFMKYEG